MVHGRSFRFALLLTVLCSMTCMQCTPSSPTGLSQDRSIEPVSSALANTMPTAPDAPLGEPSPARRNLVLAESDPLALLEEALVRWESVDSYRLKFISQERLDGVLGGMSVIEAMVMREPFAVSFRWLQNAGRVDRMVWMPSLYQQKLVVHPTGLAGKLLKSAQVDPNSEQVRSNSRRSVTSFGLAGTLRSVLDDYRRHAQAGTLNARCMGVVPGDRPALLLKRVASNRDSESQVLLVWLDAENLRPMRIEQYGWSGELLASYRFDEYQPVKLTQQDFTLAALGW